MFRNKIDGIKDVIAQLLGYRFEISRDQYPTTSLSPQYFRLPLTDTHSPQHSQTTKQTA